MRSGYVAIGVIVLAFMLAAVAVRVASVLVQRLLGTLEIVGAAGHDDDLDDASLLDQDRLLGQVHRRTNVARN